MKSLQQKIITLAWAAVPAATDTLQFLGNTAERGGLNPNPNTSPTGLISVIINAVLGAVGVVFFIQMMLAGIRWVTSEGNDEIIKHSKITIINAIIGITITFSAFIITNFVLNRLATI